ncbi:energy transducer TonB [Tunturiibacter gelidoferens]|uniref:Outer membrane biosynthesis protein TonB n=3 Tax=Tunturiibacter TaxID=3154218 RepID=A0A7Y9T347_9BACT|nr:energy transducer TonB [Edaphobacter lichenicola]MBB5338316.1 outer membrane biosynthesis protein TonB [Edaphobacter lichenicola]NYF52438.1 outer membrane biosynthesis protein TonB [Edaphobacter lichenicola]
MRTVWALLPFFLAPVSVTLEAQSMPSVVPPRLISMPAPDCRAGKACHHTHGQVRLIVDVLEDGKVGDIRVELGDSTLAEAATAAVQQAEFAAGYYLGKPQSMDVVLNFKF